MAKEMLTVVDRPLVQYADQGTSQKEELRPMSNGLESITAALVASGKGILAADESIPTLTRRFKTLGIPSTERPGGLTGKCSQHAGR